VALAFEGAAEIVETQGVNSARAQGGLKERQGLVRAVEVDEDGAEIHGDGFVIWGELAGFLQDFEGFVEPAETAQGITQIVKHRGIGWISRETGAQGSFCVLRAIREEQCAAESGLHIGIAGMELRAVLQHGDGFGELAFFLQGEAEILAGGDGLGIEREGFVVGGNGVIGFVAGFEDETAGDEGIGVRRHQLKSMIETSVGVVETILAVIDKGQVVQGAGEIVARDGDRRAVQENFVEGNGFFICGGGFRESAFVAENRAQVEVEGSILRRDRKSRAIRSDSAIEVALMVEVRGLPAEAHDFGVGRRRLRIYSSKGERCSDGAQKQGWKVERDRSSQRNAPGGDMLLWLRT